MFYNIDVVDEAALEEWRRSQHTMEPTLLDQSRYGSHPSRTGVDDGARGVNVDDAADDEDGDTLNREGYAPPALDSFDGGRVVTVSTSGPRWSPQPSTNDVITWEQFRRNVSATLNEVCSRRAITQACS